MGMEAFVAEDGVHGDPRPQITCEGPGRTKQSMKDECDVNVIMARYIKTGMITHLAKGQPDYIDVSDIGDYREALEQVRLADDYFAGLPAEVRSTFKNDPAEFLDAFADPEKQGLLEDLGLKNKLHEVVAPLVAPVEPVSGLPVPPAPVVPPQEG